MDIRYFGQNARLSEAVVAGGFVFLSGMVPENTEADVKGQTQDVLAQIDRWLEKRRPVRPKYFFRRPLFLE